MQQSIQERNVSFALLGKAEVLCNTWNRLQSKSLSLLQSISNVVSQRTATVDLPTTLEDHGVNQPRLVFNQTESIQNSVKTLKSVLVLFEKVKDDWNRLELEAVRHLTKALSQPIATKIQPLSTESMIQVTAVTSGEVHDMISILASMYKDEFAYKSRLFTTVPQNLSNIEQIQNLIDRWEEESCMDRRVQNDLAERIKLYKIVKKVLESVD